MMAAPVVSFYSRDNTTQVTLWDIGTIDAGTVSDPPFGLLVWNNRGGTSAVSDMENTTITTKDTAGGNTGDLVTNTWIEVRVDSLSESTFSAIGGTVTRPLRATDGTVAAGVIKGTANDGTKTNAIANFSEVSLRANVPGTATAGLYEFLVRISYQYV